jgi:hypothetical protein
VKSFHDFSFSIVDSAVLSRERVAHRFVPLFIERPINGRLVEGPAEAGRDELHFALSMLARAAVADQPPKPAMVRIRSIAPCAEMAFTV